MILIIDQSYIIVGLPNLIQMVHYPNNEEKLLEMELIADVAAHAVDN